MSLVSYTKEFKKKKKIVNDAIRICINCGNISVLIDNYGIYCKDCNSKFLRKSDKEDQ